MCGNPFEPTVHRQAQLPSKHEAFTKGWCHVRRRRWPNMAPTFRERLVLAGMVAFNPIYWPIKSLLLGRKSAFKHQNLQIFCGLKKNI